MESERPSRPSRPSAPAQPPVPAPGSSLTSSGTAPDARLDKWLWMVRAYKTRAEAAEACRLGRVEVDARPAKAAATVRPGQVVSARQGLIERRLVVLGVPRGRQGAAKVGEFMRDETPPEQIEAAREQRVQHLLAGGGPRPTKKDRRAREAWRASGGAP